MNIKPTLLLMDNKMEVLDTTARLLERYGYRVIQASSIEEADRIMREGYVHLAILDVRMNPNEDTIKDIDGLNLAMMPDHASLPKLIFTGFDKDTPELADALSTLKSGRDAPAVLDYVRKGNINDLLLAIDNAFNKFVRINFKLDLKWEQESAFSVLGFIDAASPDVQSRFAERVEEIESLLGQLFRDYQHIRIMKMAWRHDHLVALSVMAFRDNERQPFVVVCGNVADMAMESAKLNRYGPPARLPDATTLCMTANTSHYAANAYILGSADLQKVVTLRQTFDAAPAQAAKILETLCAEVLTNWQREKIPIGLEMGLSEWYRRRLALPPSQEAAVAFRERALSIAEQALQLGVEIDWQEESVTVYFSGLNRKRHLYPNPEHLVFEDQNGTQLKLVTQSPGLSSPDTILVQSDAGKAWLTQFGDAGQLPLHADHAAIEAMIRFDWLKTTDAQELHHFEEQLTGMEPFARIDVDSVPAQLRPALRLIHALRKQTARKSGNDPLAYHTAMLFEAVRRINAHEPRRPLLQNDIAVSFHALLGVILSAQAVAALQSSNAIPREATALLDVRFDGAEVFISGQRVAIPQKELMLLACLHQHAGKLCTHKQLFGLYGLADNPASEDSLQSMITTYVNRLRAYIEPDPKKPKYLINVRGKGYTLLCTPARPPTPDSMSIPAAPK